MDYGYTVIANQRGVKQKFVPVTCVSRSIKSRLTQTRKRLKAAMASYDNARTYEAKLRAEGKIDALESQLILWEDIKAIFDRAKSNPLRVERYDTELRRFNPTDQAQPETC